MSNSNLSPTKELADPIELANIIQHQIYPKPQWMLNDSVDDDVWILARTSFGRSYNGDTPLIFDRMDFRRTVAPGEYLTDPAWSSLLVDIRKSLLYLSIAGKITRATRIRDVLLRATYLMLHANELRSKAREQPVRSLDQVRFSDLKHYLLSFRVERHVFDSVLEIILNRWSKKSNIDWDSLEAELHLTTREFMSLRHKLIKYLDTKFDNFKSVKCQTREYPQSNSRNFDIDTDLDPKEKTVSNMISQLEALYTARPAQQHKFSHSAMTLFSSGRTIFENMLESEKTPLIPVDAFLHTLSTALYFVRNYALPLREYISDLHNTELRRIRELGYAPSTSKVYKKSIQNYAFLNTSIPDVLAPLNITSWGLETAKSRSAFWKKGLPLSSSVTLYFAAMWIILASFTAGRATSLLSLRRNCFRQSPVDGLFDILIRIPKSSERFELEEIYKPIPNLIYDYGLEFASFTCELEVRRSLLSNDSDSYLFGAILASRSVSASRYVGGELHKAPLGLDTIINALHMFQDWSESPLTDGKRWYPATHQFRRLFAVLYFSFTDQRGLEELSWFMGHANLNQTFHYAEVSPTDEWLEEAKLSIARIGAQIHKHVHGDETVKRIIDSARYSSNVSAVLEPLVHSMIEEHIAKTGAQVRFHKINGEDIFFYFSDSQGSPK